jgi:hypothetical protein
VSLCQLNAIATVALTDTEGSVVLLDALVEVDGRIVQRAVRTRHVRRRIAHLE